VYLAGRLRARPYPRDLRRDHPTRPRRARPPGPAVGFTLDLEALPFSRARCTARPALVVSDLPAVERDFGFELDERVEAEAVLRAARATDKALIAGVSAFDVFAGSAAEAEMGGQEIPRHRLPPAADRAHPD
jgi:phenylalanyl-tRNA synthetase beta chain